MVNFYLVTGFFITILLFLYSWRLPKNTLNNKQSQILTSASSKILSKLKTGKLDYKLFMNILITNMENITDYDVPESNHSQINDLKKKCENMSNKDKIDKNTFNKIFTEYQELTKGITV